MVNGIRKIYPRGLKNKFGLKFHLSSQVWHETPKGGWRMHRPKYWEYNSKDVVNSPNMLNDKTYQVFLTIIIIIIIILCCLHGFPWLSLTIHLSHSSLPTGFLDYIQCLYRAVVDKFQLVVQHLHVSMKRLLGECHLWVYHYFSSSVLFNLFGWF